MSGWAEFLFAQVGASAALAGLVFVGASINLEKIVSFPNLPNLVLEAILVLAQVLLASSLGRRAAEEAFRGRGSRRDRRFGAAPDAPPTPRSRNNLTHAKPIIARVRSGTPYPSGKLLVFCVRL